MNNESDIAERIRHGDTEAFSFIFRQQYEPLCFYAQRFMNDFDGAEGIVQEVFVRLWDARETLTIHTSLRIYLYASVKNSALNYIKRTRGFSPLEGTDEHVDKAFLLPDAQLESEEIMRMLEAAIENLPPKCREIFCLAKFDGLSYQEIAEIQNVSINTVKTQLQRALKSLTKSLQYIQVIVLLFIFSNSSLAQEPAVTLSGSPVVTGVGNNTHKMLP